MPSDKVTRKVYDSEYRKKNKERIKQDSKRYRDLNRETIREKGRLCQSKRRERIKTERINKMEEEFLKRFIKHAY